MRRWYLILLFLQVSILSGQIPSITVTHETDSLLLLLKNARNERRVDILNTLSMKLAPRWEDSSLRYAGEALRIAEQLNYKKGIGIVYFNFGNARYFRVKIKEAVTNYYIALRILDELGPSQELGDLYCQIAGFNRSLPYYKKSIQIFKDIGNRSSQTYAMLKAPKYNRDSAYALCLENLHEFQKINDKYAICQTYIDLADVCFYTRIPKGLEYAWTALGLARKMNNEWLIANAYHKIVNYYENINNAPEFEKNIPKAMDYLGRSLKILLRINSINHYYKISETYRELATLNQDLKNDDQALVYFNMAEEYIYKFLGSFDTLQFDDPKDKFFYWMSTLENLEYVKRWQIPIIRNRGDYRRAYQCMVIADSLFHYTATTGNNLDLLFLQANQQEESKRMQVEELSRKNELDRLKLNQSRLVFTGIGGLVILLFLIALLFIQRKRNRSEHKALVLEQKLLRSQMNPHFLFNSLTSIQNFIITERPEMASIYLSRFSKLMRNILDNSTEEFVPLENEICTIENYLELQSIRFAGKFDYRIKVDDNIDIEAVMIPPMMAQPFIENAIEHGIKYLPNPGHIDVRFCGFNHSILFEVEDNGVGREKAREVERDQQAGHRSMATSITRERLACLNQKHHRKISFSITDLKDNKGDATGTLVTFSVPLP